MNIVSSIYSVQALDVVLPLIYQLKELGIARTVTFVLKFAASMETPSVQFLFSCIAEVSNDILIIGDSELYREAESVFIQEGVRYKKVPTLNDQNTLDSILAGIQSKSIMLRSHADIDQDSLVLGNAIRAKGGKAFVFLEGPYPPHHSLPLKYFSYARPDAADIFLISHRSHSEDLKTVGYGKFSVIGYPKLYPAWSDLITNSAEFKELKQRNSYQVSVFTRGEEKGRDPQIIDNQTLRSILIDIIDEVSLLKDNAKILIKPHPLQDAGIIKDLIVDKKNVTITYNHPSLLAAASDLVITTWSSTIVDGLVFNVPSIEYFIENEGFRSIYPQGSSFRRMGILHANDSQSFKHCLEKATDPSYKPLDITEKLEHKMDLSVFHKLSNESEAIVKASISPYCATEKNSYSNTDNIMSFYERSCPSTTKEILLINLPAIENTYNFAIPTGLASIAKILEGMGYRVDVWDLNIEALTRSETEKKIDLLKEYPVIGISGLITTYKYLTWFIPLLREKNPQSKLIVGGGVSSQASDLLLKKGLADFVVIGEGELTIQELISSIFEKASFSEINGIGYLKNNQPFFNPKRELIKDINDIPTPAYHLFDMQKYMSVAAESRGGRRTLTFITSRGCPYSCNFCYHIFGRSYRTMCNERIIEELLKLKERYSPDLLSISDELFTANKKKVIDFCDKYKEANIGISWWCKSRVDCVDSNMFQAMKKAGCEAIGYGFESGSQKILDRMNKKTTAYQMERAVQLTRDAGMICGASFIFGYPGETIETIRETVEFCKKHSLTLDGLYYATPYPGTQLHSEVEEIIMNKYKTRENFIKVLGDTRTFIVNLTEFSDDELVELHEQAIYEINCGSDESHIGSGNDVKACKSLDTKILVSCPHCNEKLHVDREGKWACPCCKNEFIYTSDYTSASGDKISDHAFDCSVTASGYGIINVFDTTICDNNLGNEIIMESVNRELRTIFPYDFFIKLPYLDSIGKEAERYLESGKHTFLGGTNALSAKMEEYRQWGLDETNVQFIKDVVLFGVGWWQYQDEISSYTRKIMTQVLHKKLLHSVRDTYTKKQLKSIGIDNVIVTGCPTLWKLTEDKCNRIPQKKSDNVLLTFTNYNQDKSDFLLADILLKQYKKIFVWPQGPEDYHYAKSISSQFEVLCPNLEELDDLLTSSYDLDYVGTRLHAGIRALENVRRAIIIGIDNRSLEKSKDFNLPVLKRSDLDLLPDKINSSFKTIIKVPFDNIRMWREQFEDGGSDKRVRSKYKDIGYDHRQRANTYLSHKDWSAMKPISRLFGFDRGQPIDRYYIDDFLRRNGSYIRGRVLEIADNGYTSKFGSDVTKSDVLNVVPSPDATIVGDLATGNNIPEAAFDCIILTQTINVIFDVKSTLKNAIKALKPGGTLLLTAPGISQISRFDMDRWGDYWRFTDKSLKMLFSEVVPEELIQVESFGNVAVAKAFLDGLALHELPKEVLDYRDEDYQVLLTCRVNKPIFESAGKSTVPAVQENIVSFQTPLVLLYHRVANDPVDAQLLAVSPENFEAHLKELAKNYRILPLCELIREIGNGGLGPDTVAITFDDGYLDNLLNAVPVLEKCGLHATVFVTSGMVGSQKEFWWDAMERVFLLGNGLPKMLSIYDSDSKAPREWDLSTAQNRLMAYDELCAIVSSQPANEKAEFVDNLISWAGLAPGPRESHRILDPDQLTKLAASSSIEIGSHTVSHARLSELEPEQQRQEIRRSKEQLEAIIKKPVRFISYPFGLSTDFTKETVKIASEAGYEAGIANIQGNIVEPVDLYSIPRRLARNWTGETFAGWLTEGDKDRLEFETLSGRAQHLIEVQSNPGTALRTKGL